jgi:hypothetical protein
VGDLFIRARVPGFIAVQQSPYLYGRPGPSGHEQALAATGDDRQKWGRVALAWQYLARNATDHGRACNSVLRELLQFLLEPLAPDLRFWMVAGNEL